MAIFSKTSVRELWVLFIFYIWVCVFQFKMTWLKKDLYMPCEAMALSPKYWQLLMDIFMQIQGSDNITHCWYCSKLPISIHFYSVAHLPRCCVPTRKQDFVKTQILQDSDHESCHNCAIASSTLQFALNMPLHQYDHLQKNQGLNWKMTSVAMMSSQLNCVSFNMNSNSTTAWVKWWHMTRSLVTGFPGTDADLSSCSPKLRLHH